MIYSLPRFPAPRVSYMRLLGVLIGSSFDWPESSVTDHSDCSGFRFTSHSRPFPIDLSCASVSTCSKMSLREKSFIKKMNMQAEHNVSH